MLSWQTLNTVEAKANTDVHVRAVAARFQWQFDYLDGPTAPTPRCCSPQSLPVGDDGGLSCRSASRSRWTCGPRT